MAAPPAGPLLGLDWGEVRIGVALCDAHRMIASPLTTLTRRRGKRFPLGALLTLIDEHQPVGVVLGLPLAPDGSDAPSTTTVRHLADQLGAKLTIPVHLWDERMTTAKALRTVKAQGGSTRGRKGDVDALAAAILLQHYLDSHREAE